MFLKILFECQNFFMGSWCDVAITQMSIFILFVNYGALFDGVFSLFDIEGFSRRFLFGRNEIFSIQFLVKLL